LAKSKGLSPLTHQGLVLLDELRTALRRSRGHAKQKNGENNKLFTKHRANSLAIHLVPQPFAELPRINTSLTASCSPKTTRRIAVNITKLPDLLRRR
jgi:hypothetical protein